MAEQVPGLSSSLSLGKGRSFSQHCSLTKLCLELDILYQVTYVNEVATASPYVGLRIQMFLTTPDQEVPGLILWNQQH
jgi:hypothetical protein